MRSGGSYIVLPCDINESTQNNNIKNKSAYIKALLFLCMNLYKK